MTGFVAALPRIVGKKYESVGGCHYESAAEACTYFYCRACIHRPRPHWIRASFPAGIPLSLYRPDFAFNIFADGPYMDRALHAQISQSPRVGGENGETHHQNNRQSLAERV